MGALSSATARAYERCRRDEAHVVGEIGGQRGAAGGRLQRGEERRGGDVLAEMEGAEVAEDIAEEGADAEFIEKSVLGNVQSDSVLILETRPFLTELLRSEE